MEPTLVQRLSFIKYLFSIGMYQSYQPEPLCSVSILSFHDSVELFLQLSSEKLNVSKKNREFMKYWDVIDPELRDAKLSQKERMRRLNEARNALKHGSLFPSKLAIKSFRAATLDFFNENCPTIFQIEFDSISLIDLIAFERTRELLKQAESNFCKGLLYECLQNIILSFEYLIRDYEESKRDRFSRSPFFFGESMTFLKGYHLGLDFNDRTEGRKFRDFVDKVTESIEAIQTAIKLLSFGVDYKKYVKFRSIVSSVQVMISDGGTIRSYIHGEIKLSKEDLDFCTNFIVESALKLQEFDFELKRQ